MTAITTKRTKFGSDFGSIYGHSLTTEQSVRAPFSRSTLERQIRDLAAHSRAALADFLMNLRSEFTDQHCTKGF
jgi:hypothetical protein